MRRSAVAESLKQGGKTPLKFVQAVSGDGERLDHDVWPVVSDGSGGEFDAVADDVVLPSQDVFRIGGSFQCFEAPLGHRERIVAELDLARVRVTLVHRKIYGPAEAKCAVIDQIEFLAELGAGYAREGRRPGGLVAHEEDSVSGANPGRIANRCFGFGHQKLRDRALAALVVVDHVAKPGRALLSGPAIEPIEKAPWTLGCVRGRNAAHDGSLFDLAPERAERDPLELERSGNVGDFQRVAKVRLVGSVAQHCITPPDPREAAAGNRSASVFGEHVAEERLHGLEHVILRRERQLDIELIELSGTSVGPGIFVSEAGSNLEVAIEARGHQKLLELLRSLRQGVELSRMQATRDQKVSSAFR